MNLNKKNLTYLFLICVSQNDVEDMLDLSEMRQDMMDRVTGIMNKANEYRSSFDAYAYLWLDDRNEFMRQFLLYNHVLTAEEIEAHAEEGVPENPPTLAQFKEQVNKKYTIYYGVNKKKYERCNKSSHWLSNWLQLNEVEQKCIRERET